MVKKTDSTKSGVARRGAASRRMLYVVRHAKSKRAKGGITDYERCLTKRGNVDAQNFAEKLKQSGASVDRIIASSAPRGRDTANIIASTLNLPVDSVHFDRHLYGATVQHWLANLRRLDDALVRQVVAVGHNPEIELLVRRLTGQASIQTPPCGAVALSFKGSWKDIAHTRQTSPQLEWSHYPDQYSDIRPEILGATDKVVDAALASLPVGFNTDLSRKIITKAASKAVASVFNRHRRHGDLAGSRTIDSRTTGSSRAGDRRSARISTGSASGAVARKPLAKKTPAAKARPTRAAAKARPTRTAAKARPTRTAAKARPTRTATKARPAGKRSSVRATTAARASRRTTR